MNKELREQVADKISSEFGDGEPNLIFADELITLILDEVDEVVESMSDYIHHNGFLFKRSLKERLDNLRGNDE